MDTCIPAPSRASASAQAPPAAAGLSRTQIAVFAVAAGLAAGNVYYAQPLLGLIGRSFGVGHTLSGLIVTITQLGYAAGLLLIAPLGDVLENRRLITAILSGTIVALLAAAYSPRFGAFLAASAAIGVTSVAAQVLVPLAARFAPPEARGRVVGQVMSGLLAGILLARTVAGVVSGAFGWRSVYVLSAVLLAVMVGVLYRTLPTHRPTFRNHYGALLASLGEIFLREPNLRRRVAYQAAMFGAFSAFWTSITFLLSAPPFGLSQTGIGLFSLAGAAGALIAPVAGRLGDAGHGRNASGIAFLVGAAGFGVTLLQHHLAALVAGAILIDLAAQTSLVLGQRVIYALRPAERSRLNTLYIATFFIGGAAGSALSALAYARMGWHGVVLLGGILPLSAFAFWLTERGADAR